MGKQNKDKTKQAAVKAKPDPITRSGFKSPNNNNKKQNNSAAHDSTDKQRIKSSVAMADNTTQFRRRVLTILCCKKYTVPIHRPMALCLMGGMELSS